MLRSSIFQIRHGITAKTMSTGHNTITRRQHRTTSQRGRRGRGNVITSKIAIQTFGQRGWRFWNEILSAQRMEMQLLLVRRYHSRLKFMGLVKRGISFQSILQQKSKRFLNLSIFQFFWNISLGINWESKLINKEGSKSVCMIFAFASILYRLFHRQEIIMWTRIFYPYTKIHL